MAAAPPHVMVLPFPAQGHVTPLMELSHRLVDHGFEVTFICTGLTHSLLLDTMRRNTDGNRSGEALVEGIRLVSVPDGMAEGDDRRDLCKFLEAISRRVPGYVGDLIRETEASRGTKVKWLVADMNMGFCFQAARNVGVRVAGFWPAAASCLGTAFRIPQIIQDGFIDDKGFPKRQGSYEVAPKMPPLYASHLPWSIDGPSDEQRVVFQLTSGFTRWTSLTEITVCNSFLDAEPTAFELFPEIVPIGPLFADQELRKPIGQFWPEDMSCLEWLDAHPISSVVYVAFGSLTIFGSRQFQELAEGLELTGRPFLWVVRPDFTSGNVNKVWFDEFQSRIAGKGMIVSWCPQQQVLAHPSVGCFVSHCGWNSTTEGVRNGMPILCWPYFADQFTNRSYVCDIWMTGLAVPPGEEGIVTKEEVMIFAYLCDIDRLSTRANLFFKSCAPTDVCAACDEVETGRHLFFDCALASSVWTRLGVAIPTDRFSFWSLPPPQGFDTSTWQAGCAVILWVLWKARNDLVFNSRTCTTTLVIRRVCADLSTWSWRFKPHERLRLDALRSFLLSRCNS